MGIVASLAASQVAHEVIEDEARRELVNHWCSCLVKRREISQQWLLVIIQTF